MILRPRQELLVERCVEALDKYGNTLAVAPTGAGKTVMLSAVIGNLLKKGAERAIILQHRDELTAQNRKTFHAVNPSVERTGVIDAANKEWRQPIQFAMVQTLARNLNYLQPTDIAIIDEAHHSTAKTYRNIVDRLYELNPDTKIAGFTATAQRGDKTPLRDIFSNVSDQITLAELVRAGVLVKPRFFVVDIGVQEELSNVRKLASDFDMLEVSKIMDQQPLNNQVVEKWKEHAGDRQTVVFCSTVSHAEHVLEAFRRDCVSAELITALTPKDDRRHILADFEACKFQVLVNVAVLTEGWDCPPVSCVVLLRPASYKSTMIQMAGRGLRKLDPERYPDRVKTDCLILDFGTSVLTHGTLEMDAELDPELLKGAALMKECPSCEGEVPLNVKECPLCGHIFEEASETLKTGEFDDGEAPEFILREIDIFDASPFRWEEFFDSRVLIANGFNAWTMTIWLNGEWHALGATKGCQIRHLAKGEKIICLSTADDFIRAHEQEDAAHKSRRWLHLPATDKQLAHLGMVPAQSVGVNRYRASCLLTWKFNEARVQIKLQQVCGRMAA